MVVQYSHLKEFPQFVVMHKVKGFSIVSEAELDIFLEFPYFLHYSLNAGSLTFAFPEHNLYIWKFSVYILLKRGLQHCEHYVASM